MARPVGDSIRLLTRRNNHNGTPEEEFISGLVQGGSWKFDGGPRVITYSFDLNFDAPSSRWNNTWMRAVDRAFDAWEAVIDVELRRVGTANARRQNESTADIAIALQPAPGASLAGQGIFPDPHVGDVFLRDLGYSRTGGRFPVPRPEGDITFNSRHPVFDSFAPGSAGFKVLLHEVGHALGLKHAGDDGLNHRPTFSELGLDRYKEQAYTLMLQGGSVYGSHHAATPLLADILAIQRIYGANRSSTGDDTYAISGRSSRGVWDAGGVDTLDFTAWDGRRLKIDLAAGMISEAAGPARIGIGFGVTIENAIGSRGRDRLTGNDSENRLVGGSGNDTLTGGSGADTLEGGEDDDLYLVDSEEDVIVEVFHGGEDTVHSSVSWSIQGPILEHLVLTGSDDVNGTGNEFQNQIIGNAGDNYLEGGAANDTLDGGGGADTMKGGLGNDVYFVDSELDVLFAEETDTDFGGSDTVHVNFTYVLPDLYENLVLGPSVQTGSGNAGNNRLVGNDIGNVLASFAGNDTLDGGSGIDTLQGGTGHDLYFVENPGDLVQEDASAGNDTVHSSARDFVLPLNLEMLLLLGSAHINATGNTGNDLMFGNSGRNVLSGAEGNDALDGSFGADVLNGDAGHDSLMGGHGKDTINGGEGNDSLFGGEDSDLLVGGDGHDVLMAGNGSDTMLGGDGDELYLVDTLNDVVTELVDSGTDTIQSSVSYELPDNFEALILEFTATVGIGNDLDNYIRSFGGSGKSMFGGAGNDTLEGSGTLDGGAGDDVLLGGSGNDIFFVGLGDDTIVEHSSGGIDHVFSVSSYTLDDHVENLTLTGSESAQATGNGLTNVITGNNADNVLDGGLNRDTLIGGGGNDTYLMGEVVSSFIEINRGPGLNDFVLLTAGERLATDSSTDSDSLVDTVRITHPTSQFSSAGVVFSTSKLDAPLLPGEYESAERHPFESAGHAGIQVFIDHMAMMGESSFNVLAAEFDYSGAEPAIVHLLVEFDMQQGSTHWTGTVGINHEWDGLLDLVVEGVDGGTDTVETPFSYTLVDNVENLVLTGEGDIDGTGNVLLNAITGNSGANVIDGGGGQDSLAGGNGEDTLVWDAADAHVDGGDDTDTLQVTADLDLTGIDDDIILSIEQIDLAGDADSNTLTLAEADVLAICEGTLTILGDGSDTVDIVGDFTAGAEADGFRTYTVGSATLLIDSEITSVA